MRLFPIGALCLFVLTGVAARAGVRHIPTQTDQISTVRTALGIATIIQVPDRPTSVVIGDQSAFKVEYLDQAVTIKPLIPNAKTNLYIYTDWQRYNIKLISTSKEQADYVVYLNPKSSNKKSTRISWKKFRNYLKNENIRLDVEEIGSAPGGLLLVKFEIQSKTTEKFKPEWLWLSQKGNIIPIHQLFLNKLKLDPQDKVAGIIQLRKEDLSPNSPFRIELRRKRISYLTVKEPRKW